jgi:penicillin-binding protein A
MTRAVRNVALVTFLLFAALFVNLNYIQVLQASELRNDTRNARGLIREYEIARGSMLLGEGADEVEIATVEETDGSLRYLRRYPDPELYAHVTGYHSFVFGRGELEASFNDYLTGSAPESFARNIADYLAGREREGDDLALTIDERAQQAARDALGDQRGAVAALDPRTGDVLALWSNPSYDPNRLSSHDGADIRAYWEALQEDPARPLANRAVREWYPPGSTFKIVTAAAALENGMSPGQTFPDPVRQELPLTTATIGNFGGGTCTGGGSITLTRALEVSCNTTFARIALDLGGDALIEQSERFGLNQGWELQLPNPRGGAIPEELDPPSAAQSAIGQRDVRVSPLHMAMITAAIGNDGMLMQPRLVSRVTDVAGRTVRSIEPRELQFGGGPPISPATARALTDMMVGVVERGTGGNAGIGGVQVAGKTGTAQTGEDRAPTVWFTGFAPAADPEIAVAVVIEDGGRAGTDATGGALAAPVARAVMDAVVSSG